MFIENQKHFMEYQILEESAVKYLSLFEIENSNIISKQLKIFEQLEKKFNITNANKFENLVHFQNAGLQPVQRWFDYREGYTTSLVNIFLKELNIKGNVLDPFCGSGTTLLSARKVNIQSIGFEVNPISSFVAKCENSYYSNEDIRNLEISLWEFKNLQKNEKTYTTNFELSDKIFNTEILQSILFLKEWIVNIKNENIKNLFYLSWLSVFEKVSNIKKEGNGIKYKTRKRTPNGYIQIDKHKWENQNFPADKFEFVKGKIGNNLENIIFDLKNNYGTINKVPEIYNEDCLKLDKFLNKEIELTFYSPPYCNCFDYFEIHKVELWLGDFIKNKEDFRELRNKGVRSNTNAVKNKPIIYRNNNLENLIQLFDVEKLWDKNILFVVRGYFDDTKTLLEKLYVVTQKRGFVGIVVGNSAYTGVIIPTDLIIAEIAQTIGFEVKNIFITRHLTTSSQQKKQLENVKYFLRESIILLQK